MSPSLHMTTRFYPDGMLEKVQGWRHTRPHQCRTQLHFCSTYQPEGQRVCLYECENLLYTNNWFFQCCPSLSLGWPHSVWVWSWLVGEQRVLYVEHIWFCLLCTAWVCCLQHVLGFDEGSYALYMHKADEPTIKYICFVCVVHIFIWGDGD